MMLPFSIAVVSGNPNIPIRCFTPLAFFPAMVLVLIYNSLRKNNVFSNILISAAALIVFYNTQELNQMFYTENLKFKNDVNFANNLYYDLSKMNLQNKPIVFVGRKQDEKYRHEYLGAGEITISTFNWDKHKGFAHELFEIRGHCFMRELGYDVKNVSNEDILDRYNMEDFIVFVRKNTKEMNIYPQENSIRDFDWFVLIKIGKSKADED